MLLKEFSTIFDRPEKVKKLREYILNLAVRGKLVEQDENDEPASVLLERIRDEKNRLVKEKKIKKEKTLPEISKDEIPYELPKGWEWVRLGNISQFIDYRGKTPKKTDFGVKLITAKNIKFGYISMTPEEFISKEDYEPWMTRGIPEYGDVIFTTEAPLGNVAQLFITEKFALAQRAITFKTFCNFNKSYLKYTLMSNNIREMIFSKATGTTALGIKASRLKEIIIPIASLNEQKRIVEKLDYLMEFCDKLEEQLEKQVKYGSLSAKSVLNGVSNCSSYEELEEALRFIIKNFKDLTLADGAVGELKNAILSLAVKGKLVPQDENDEPASVLLERIREEKDRLVKEKMIKKEKPLPEISENEIPYELPIGWEWIRLGDYTQINPRNNADDDLDTSFVPMKLIDDGFSNSHTFEAKKWSEIKKGFTHFAERDVVVAKITPCFENRKSAVMNGLINGIGAGTTELYVVRSFNELILPEYILNVFKTHEFIKGGVDTYTGTAGQQRVKKDYISNLIVAIPPLNEQKRIVEKVDKLMKVCDELELRIEESKKYSEKLMESILKESFKA